jgi:hypothetical protein
VPTIGEVARDGDLTTLVKGLNRSQAVARVAGLMLLPEYHANILRLEMLAHLATTFSRGNIEVTGEILHTLLNRALRSHIGPAEEPRRDVFVTNVVTRAGNCRLLVGDWETPDYWVQDLIAIVESMPNKESFRALTAGLLSLLRQSERIISRVDLPRYHSGAGIPGAEIQLPSQDRIEWIGKAVCIRNEDFTDLSFDKLENLQPFLFQEAQSDALLDQRLGNSDLERRPFLAFQNVGYINALPNSISVAARHFVLSKVQSLGLLDAFSTSIRLKQEGDFHNIARHKAAGKSMKQVQLAKPLATGLDWIGFYAEKFDDDKAVFFVLLRDDYQDVLHSGLTRPNFLGVQRGIELRAHVARSVLSLIKRGYSAGLVLFVLCGVGRAFLLPSIPLPVGWMVDGMRLSDLVGLSWMEESWLMELWQLGKRMEELVANEIAITGTDQLGLFSYWKERGRLVPLEAPYRQQPIEIELDNGYVEKIRRAARLAYDRHSVYHPLSGQWREVQKLFPQTYFKELSLLPLYASVGDAQAQLLNGVAEGNDRHFWVYVSPTPESKWMRDLLYRIWEAVLIWIAKAIPVLLGHFPRLQPCTVLQIDPSSLGERFGPPTLKELSDSDRISVLGESQAAEITIHLRLPLFRNLARADNLGERELVTAIVRALAIQVDKRLAEREAEAIVREIMPSDDAKFIHFFQGQDVRDQLSDADRVSLISINERQILATQLGLAWEVIRPTSAFKIVGEEEVQEFLHLTVDVLWERIRSGLQALRKQHAVMVLLANAESANVDRRWWRRTSRALLSVYSDKQDVLSAAQQQESRFSQAGLCSRVAVEMANCECPLNSGKRLTESDARDLLSDISFMIHVACDSDAVYRGMAEPEIEIAPNGEFKLKSEFIESTVRPYQSGYFASQFERAAADYGKLFRERPEEGRPVEELYEARYRHAFEQEFGLSIASLVDCEQVLSFVAMEQEAFLTTTSLMEVEEQFLNHGIAERDFRAFLESFVLIPRERWDITPAGFRRHDWEPWRFRRRLSLMARPIVQLSPGSAGRLVYSAGMLHDSLGNVVDGGYKGRLDQNFFRSVAMQEWIGHVNDRAGHEFNATIAQLFRDKGFTARDSIMMSELGGTPELGDCDVLAAHAAKNLAYVVECKKLRSALTVGEIGDQLVRFRGEELDKLDRHLRRVKWIGNRKNLLTRFFGSPLDEAEVRSLLVTNTVVPMSFQKGLPVPAEEIVTSRRLPAVLMKALDADL